MVCLESTVLFRRCVLTFICRAGAYRGGKGQNDPCAESLGSRKRQYCKYCLQYVNVLPKDLKFEHRGAKLVSCPGRHLTSVRPWCRVRHRSKLENHYLTYVGNALSFVQTWTYNSSNQTSCSWTDQQCRHWDLNPPISPCCKPFDFFPVVCNPYTGVRFSIAAAG